MPYLGKSPSFGVRQRYQYTATASQTTFSGTDTANLTLNYTDNNFVDVYQNGVLLKGGGNDYTATSGTSVVLGTGATADDVIEIIVYDAFSAANFYSRTDSDSRYVNVDGDSMTGDLELKADSARLKFGADSEVILRHSADNGLQLEGSGLNTNFTINAFHATDSTTPDLDLHKSGSSTVGTQAATADGEALGQIRFSGVDTSGSSRTGATISAAQVGTASSAVTADLTIDAAGDIILDADGNQVHFKDGGTEIGVFQNSSSDFMIEARQQDKDIKFAGNDGGSGITALTLDMSAGGEATFNDNVIIGFQQGYKVGGGSGNSTVSFTTTTGDGGANTVLVYWIATYGSDRSGGCLGAYNRSNVYSAPSASISNSNQFAIYGVIAN